VRLIYVAGRMEKLRRPGRIDYIAHDQIVENASQDKGKMIGSVRKMQVLRLRLSR
jgi:hypothetical protein